ncbi:MAG: lysophospholipase [Oligoflexales bacterium]|nr:lysophospholipase [Oligoflexales bacterium]
MSDRGKTEASFQSLDNLNLFYRTWFPLQEHKANIVIVHGLGEHSGRYDRLASELSEKGLAVFAYDVRGHGQSQGEKCYVNDFNDYLHDLESFLGEITPKFNAKPWFLFGHSAGGEHVVTYVLKMHPNCQGVVLSSPALKAGADISPFLIKISGLVNALLPRLKVLGIDPTAISRIPAEIEKYKNDPLIYHDKIPTRTGYNLQKYFNYIQINGHKFILPVLIMHGTADRLTNIEGSQEFYRIISSEDRTLKLYENSFHEIFNDLDRQTAVDDLLAWLMKRI